MLRITKQTDYGIMLLARMAELPAGRVLSTADAARWSGLSRPMVSKILKSLARGHIIASHRGVGGGYTLRCSPDETTVAGVIRALEGPISMVECGAQPGQCGQEPVCPTRINWARINREIERALDSIPISARTAGPSASLLTLGPPGGPRRGRRTPARDDETERA
jgi:FeS assembly SUF system regulator